MKLNDYDIEVTCDQPLIPKWRAWSNKYPVYGSAFGVTAGDAVAELLNLIERVHGEKGESI
jgi:hypothetical protein